jgi:hypothetical protein
LFNYFPVNHVRFKSGFFALKDIFGFVITLGRSGGGANLGANMTPGAVPGPIF